MTDKLQNNDGKEFLYGLPDEPEYNEKGELLFTWKEKPVKPGYERPIIIHRAIYGSLERMIAIIIESYGGKFPFWLSPTQAIVVPISEKSASYAELAYEYLKMKGYNISVDTTANTLNYKVRQAQINRYNVILVVGEKEMEEATFDVRLMDGSRKGKMTMNQLINYFEEMQPKPSSYYFDVMTRWEHYEKTHLKSDLIDDEILQQKKKSVEKIHIDLNKANSELDNKDFLGGNSPNKDDNLLLE